MPHGPRACEQQEKVSPVRCGYVQQWTCCIHHGTYRSQIGAFVVTKKNGKQRLIVDARTNRLFRTPPSTLLGSMDCWGRLESDIEFFVAQEDVKDFFYRLGIPHDLGRYFCFPHIDPHLFQTELGHMPEELRALVHRDGRPVHPCTRVLPMGFGWAFHLAHQAHVEITRRALPRTPHIKDKSVTPRFGVESNRARTSMQTTTITLDWSQTA